MAGSPVWDACFFVYYFMDEEKVMNEKEKVNQITEGVIWKQLLIFFFPIVNVFIISYQLNFSAK